jgi:hypothetical protein
MFLLVVLEIRILTPGHIRFFSGKVLLGIEHKGVQCCEKRPLMCVSGRLLDEGVEKFQELPMLFVKLRDSYAVRVFPGKFAHDRKEYTASQPWLQPEMV